MHDGPRRAAEEESLQESVAAGADDHEVGSPGPGLMDDRGGRMAFDGDRARGEAVGAKPGCHRRRHVAAAPLALRRDGGVAVERICTITRDVTQPPRRIDIDRMHDSHVTVTEEPASADELGSRHRDVRSVRADQDAFRNRASRHEDGTGSLVDDLRRHGAEERFLDRTVAPGAKDHQIRPDVPRRVDDDRGGTALDQSSRDVQPELAEGSGCPLEQRRSVRPQAVPRDVGGDVGDTGEPGAADPLGLRGQDCQDLQLGSGGPGEARRQFDAERRFRGSIDRDQRLHQSLL